MDVEYVNIDKIKPYKRNARKNDGAVDYVANSIKDFGWRVPLIVDGDYVLIAGHTRYKAAQKLGIQDVPVLKVDDLTEEQVKAFRLADNKTQELSSWDFSKLMGELKGIDAFDMSLVGFGGFAEEEDEAEGPRTSGRKQHLDDGFELDLGSFDDESFEYVCPCCGFRFNEKE